MRASLLLLALFMGAFISNRLLAGNITRTTPTRLAAPAAVPPNDECSGAISLPVNANAGSALVYYGSTGNATQSMPTCYPTGYAAPDVWFTFTATGNTHRIMVMPTESYHDYIFQVFSGSCGSLIPISCANTGGSGDLDAAVVTGLMPGLKYYMRLYDSHGSTENNSFRIVINTASSLLDNDECTGALNVVAGPDTNWGAPTGANNTGATQSMPGCFGTAEDDMWFKFTATSSRHYLAVVVNHDINPVVEVFKGDCVSLTSIACKYINNGSPYSELNIDIPNLITGQTYYFRIYGSGSNNIRSNLYVLMSTPPRGPSNDECSGAISLPVNANSSSALVYFGNTGYATQSMPTCYPTGLAASDVWFSFTATATAHRIMVTPSTSSDNYIFEVFSGTCGNLSSIGCFNNGSEGDLDVALVPGLIPGNRYYMRLYDSHGGASPGNEFKIIINTASSLLDNDECTGAFNVVPGPDLNWGTPTGANNIGATQSLPGCFGTAEDDMWFKFTATSSRHYLTVIVNHKINPVVEIFKGDCSSLTSIACKYFNNGVDYDQISTDLTNLIAGQTYYFRIYGSSSNNVRSNLYVRMATPSNTPPNDECSGAISLPVNSNSSSALVYFGNTGYATQSMPSCYPTGFASSDAWFSFTATATAHRIMVLPIASSDDYIFQVFTGTCGSLSPISCVNTGRAGDLDVAIVPGLIPGNKYYMRLYDFNGGASPDNEFKIIINTAGSLLDNDECTGALNVVPSPDLNMGAATGANNIGATQSMPGCYGTAEDDMWFKFTAISSQHHLAVVANQAINPVVEVFKGDCSSITSIACKSDGGTAYSKELDLTNLISDQTYYYRVYGSSSNNTRSNMYTLITTPPIAPVNDECSGAISLPVNTDKSTLLYSGRLGYATQSLASCNGSGAARDAWYKFTAMASAHRITVSSNSGDNYVYEVYSGTCGNLTSTACVNNGAAIDEATLTTLTPGNTYFMRVYNSSGAATPANAYSLGINMATAALPVELYSFNVVAENNSNLLSWKTSSESNNAGFEVQYSKDGLLFDAIAFVRSAANNGYSSSPLSYSYVHAYGTVNPGKLYYRLKQIDRDGKIAYSKVVSVNRNNAGSNLFIYPNPVVDRINLGGANNLQELAYIVTDIPGRIVMQGVARSNGIDVSGLKQGVYFLKLLDKEKSSVFKFIRE